MLRPDVEAEVIRRTNAAARIPADKVILVGLSDDTAEKFVERIPKQVLSIVRADSDLARLTGGASHLSPEPLVWGPDRIGIGLLKALRARRSIVFTDTSPVENYVPPISDHLVVCEDGDEFAQVVAANYAYALDAGLHIFPSPSEEYADQIMDSLYTLYEPNDQSPTQILESIAQQLRNICGSPNIPVGGSISFITGKLPYGFGFPEVPTTHLFKYPDLGIAIVNGFAAEQKYAKGLLVGLFLDPSTADAPEIADARRIFLERGLFVRGSIGPAANVHDVTILVEMFPYDFLIIATHCSDAKGMRWTYNFTDSQGQVREVIVEKAIGIGRKNFKRGSPVRDDELLEVMEQTRFVSLDGVAWNDPDIETKIHVGSAKRDFLEWTIGVGEKKRRRDERLQPSKKESIPRVPGAAALRMYDHSYLPVPQYVAGNGSPIILNNACVSWHELAGTFTFVGARAYIGTLTEATTSEAQEFTVKLLGKYFGKFLPVAAWRAQRDIYQDGVRRPYAVTGVFTQSLKMKRESAPQHILRELMEGKAAWKKKLEQCPPDEEFRISKSKEYIEFYEHEIAGFRQWLTAKRPK